jgi:hypothetical protein
MPLNPMGKRGFSSGLSLRDAGRSTHAMRVMFFTWLVLIATGLAFYTVIGLAHN